MKSHAIPIFERLILWLTSEFYGNLVIFFGIKKRFLHKIEQEIEKYNSIFGLR
jgi:hypothetical protein